MDDVEFWGAFLFNCPTRIQAIQGGQALGARLKHAARPQAASGIALAIVETLGGGVVVDRGDFDQLGLPMGGAVNAVAQRNDQTTALGRCDATGLLRHVPALGHHAVQAGAVDFFAWNIDPIQQLLSRMPKRRLPQHVGGGADGGPNWIL